MILTAPLVSLTIAVAPSAQPAPPVCHVNWSHGLPAPDNKLNCTPGSTRHLTRREVCASKTRPTLRAADRREILTEYGKPGWTGADGELDHRVPVFLGGNTNPGNIWPERGGIPNAKDRLEFRVYRRVCFSDPFRLSPRTGRRLFLADWRHTYRVWRQDGVL